MKNHSAKDFARFDNAISSSEQITESYKISGPYDYLLKFICVDVKAYNILSDHKSLRVRPGFTIVGWLHGVSGNYQLCLLLFAAALVIAILSILPFKLSTTNDPVVE